MPETCTGVMRKALIAFGLAVVFAAPACVVAGEGTIQDLLGLKGKTGAGKSAAEWTASLVPGDRAGEFVLRISVKLPPEHHVYSMTKGEGEETKIEIVRASGLEPLGDAFVPDHDPKVVFDMDLGRNVEKYLDHVIWTKHFRLKPGTLTGKVAIAGIVNYQICNPDTCKLEKYAFDVKPAAAPAVTRETASASNSENPHASIVSTRFEHVHKETVEGTWTVEVAPRQARAGDEVTITVRADLNPGWHVYSLDLKISSDGGSVPTVIGFTELGGLVPQGDTFTGPIPLEKPSEESPGKIDRYHEGRIEWTRKLTIPKGTTEGDIPLAGKVAWTMCNVRMCLPASGFEFTGKVSVAEETVADALPFAVTAKMSSTEASQIIDDLGLHAPDEPAAVDAGPPGKNDAVGNAPAPGIRAQGLFAFLTLAVVAGFAALLTPCVFPMIPITVSFFQKQSEKQHHRPITMAVVYCLGIMGTFTGLGMLMSILFGAGALNELANNVWLNLFIGGVLIFFSLNLLGMFEIRVPSWLLTYTAGKESHGGFIGVLFMALTFTLTSFTCTFAFAGLLLAEAMKGDRLWPILGLLAFSAAFSLPFFFLALFPSMLQKLPKSGGWMNVVKVIMGLVEMGAAFKYFGTADLSWNGEAAIFDFHLMISAWAVISIACALYLLGMFRLPHDTPADHIGAFRFVSAMSFMGLASYLAVGLFSAEKPHGAVWKYVEAYANPNFEGGVDRMGPFLEHGPMKLKYALDFERAFEVAIAENKPVFLDITGFNCTNCRWMEKGPMSRPEIEEKLKQFVRVQLFTDKVPKEGVADPNEAQRLKEFNVKVQEEWYGDVSLPSYLVIPPDRSVLKNPRDFRSKILAELAGKNDEATFSQFLDRGLDGWKKVQAQKNAPIVGKR